MSDIILPAITRQRPQYPAEIDRAWATKVAFASMTGLPGSGNRDLVTRTVPTASGTMSLRGSPRGMASHASTVSSGLVWSSLRPISDVFTTGAAILVIANPAAQATQQRAFFLGDELPAVSNQYNQICFGFNINKAGTGTSGIFSTFEYNFGFQAASQSTAAAVDGQWHVFGASRPAGFGAWTLYRDGLDVTAASPNSANGVPLTDGCRVHVHPQATAGYNGEAVLAVAFNQPLDASTMKRLAVNPWQIIRSIPRRIWYTASAPASFNPAWARNSNVMIGTHR